MGGSTRRACALTELLADGPNPIRHASVAGDRAVAWRMAMPAWAAGTMPGLVRHSGIAES
jgi:hypothetical protein